MSEDTAPHIDPKTEFSGVSTDAENNPDIPGSEADESIRIQGQGNLDETPEQEAERKKRAKDELDRAALAEELEEQKKQEKEQDKDKEQKPEQDGNEVAFEADADKMAVSGYSRYGIIDKGDYLKIKGQGKRPNPFGPREITDQQLRLALMMSVLSKGWSDKIEIYRGGRIDSQLTGRAQMMLQGDQGLCQALQGRKTPRVTEMLPEKPPVWAKSGAAQWVHGRRFKAQQKAMEKAGEKAQRQVNNRLAEKFKDPVSGESLRDQLKKPQAEANNPGANGAQPAPPEAP